MKTSRTLVATILSLVVFFGHTAILPAEGELPALVQKIETRLGISLTITQREEIAYVSREAWADIHLAAEEYVLDVAGLFGFGDDFMKEALPAHGLPLSSLERDVVRMAQDRLEEEFSWDQTKALEAAAAKRRASVKAVQAVYATRVSGITDIPSEEVLGMLSLQ